MTLCESPLLWSLLGVKRTCRFAPQMSAYDPKRTLMLASHARSLAPQRFRCQICPFCQRVQFRPGELRVNAAAQAAIRPANNVFSTDDLCIGQQAVCDEFGV